MVKRSDGYIQDRTETLFVSDEYKLFFLTGQPNGSGRKAAIAVQPFHAVSPEVQGDLREKAIEWVDGEGMVTVTPGASILSFHDGCTGVNTIVSKRVLEPDSKVKDVSEAFLKYASPARTVCDIAVGKPLSFKKNNRREEKTRQDTRSEGMTIGLDGYLDERIETLYVCDAYKLFFLTGQAENNGGRRAYVAVKPFHALDEETVAAMKSAARVWTEGESRIRIGSDRQRLAFHDELTGTVSHTPWSELDADVQRRLRGITDPFSKYAVKMAETEGTPPAPTLRKLRGFHL